ncbi:MAG: B12-binding domain-containing radical SAM protein, partial [Candidatus Marinimicrobia bacterium]|nr:B12-binding domain-containing radical SAM protein [Candidatus Neomarinimicrobiota bacterium]
MIKNIHSINYDREILPSVEKPGRYAGHEFNIQHKDLSKIKASIVLAYPDLYDIGMSYYGFQVLYHILNRDSEVSAERVYAPWPDFEKQLRKLFIPLYSLESHTSLHQFDIVGFTLSYELTFTNILNMLDLSGIPIWSDQRKVGDPFVIAGGVGAYNPEPLAPFIDFFVVGDAEEVIVSVVKFVAYKRRKKVPRIEILKGLASRFSGIYVSALYEFNKGKKGLLDPPISRFDYIPEKVKSIRVSKLLSDFYPDSPV